MSYAKERMQKWFDDSTEISEELNAAGQPGLAGMIMLTVAQAMSPTIDDHELHRLVHALAVATLPKAEEKLSPLLKIMPEGLEDDLG